MSLDAASPARTEGNAVRASLAWARRGSLAVLALLVAEFGIGMYVNLYVTIPNADQGGGLGSAIANGPAMLSIHAVIGMLLGLGALGVLVQAFMSRHLGAMALSASMIHGCEVLAWRAGRIGF